MLFDNFKSCLVDILSNLILSTFSKKLENYKMFNSTLSGTFSKYVTILIRVMVFNTTFHNISVILWRSVLLVEETGVPGENLILIRK
jgi:hypothetical protein